jgi:hypothetical protein
LVRKWSFIPFLSSLFVCLTPESSNYICHPLLLLVQILKTVKFLISYEHKLVIKDC